MNFPKEHAWFEVAVAPETLPFPLKAREAAAVPAVKQSQPEEETVARPVEQNSAVHYSSQHPVEAQPDRHSSEEAPSRRGGHPAAAEAVTFDGSVGN